VTRRLRVAADALEEAAAAAVWYERQRPGLGTEFVRALEAAFDMLEGEIAPLAAARGAADALGLMRLRLRRFPFDVIVVDAGRDRFVIAIAHLARRPGYWRDRLKN
jgi:hypothetical protein